MLKKITGILVLPKDANHIKVVVNMHDNDVIGYDSCIITDINDSININLCYKLTFATSESNISDTFSIPINTSYNNIKLNIKAYAANGFTSACDYAQIIDSVFYCFGIPVESVLAYNLKNKPVAAYKY